MANGRIFNNNIYSNKLKSISDKYAVGIDAVALRFIIDNLEPSYVLSGASNISELEQNLKALNFKLTKDEIKNLSALKSNPEAYWNVRNELEWN